MPLVLDGTNGVSGVDGTASNPTIEGTDSNTGIFYPAADTVAIGTGGTERLRVDSAGNAGLAITPSAWAASWKVLQLQGGFVGGNAVTSQLIASNSYSDGTNWRYVNTGAATQYAQTSGAHSWSIAASGTAGNAITFTQAMTLDASGNLGLGQTPSTRKFEINAIPVAANQLNGMRLQWAGGATAAAEFLLGTDGSGIPFTSLRTGNDANSYMTFFTGSGPTERARIDSNGNLLVARTSSQFFGGAAKFGVEQTSNLAFAIGVNANGPAVVFNSTSNTSSAVGSISVTASATTYSTSSDYRLKENVQPMTGALAKVAALKPCTYTWKVDGSEGQGFIAHELAEVVPDAVTGEKDAVDEDGNIKPQGIDTSFLVATLTAAIQELNAKLEAQAAEIAALKGNA